MVSIRCESMTKTNENFSKMLNDLFIFVFKFKFKKKYLSFKLNKKGQKVFKIILSKCSKNVLFYK